MNICDEKQKRTSIYFCLSECRTYLLFGSGSNSGSGNNNIRITNKKNNHLTQPYSMHFRSVQKFQSFSSVLQSNSIRIDYYYDCVHICMLLHFIRCDVFLFYLAFHFVILFRLHGTLAQSIIKSTKNTH